MDDFRVTFRPALSGVSRYRLLDGAGGEVSAVCEFLDTMVLRGLSERTLRTYAYALLSAWKWLRKASRSIEELTETHLADYIRYLRERSGEGSPPAPRSINLRLGVLRCLYRFQTGGDLPRGAKVPPQPIPLFVQASRVGARPTRRMGRPALRVKVPRRLIVPLVREQLVRLFESFRTARDLSIAALMLFCGLRSREVLILRLKDLDLLGEEIRVSGKGDRDRVLPLAPYVRKALSAYLDRERPPGRHDAVFLNLKGPARGSPMTPTGLRGLFRYHRIRSGVREANPHRLRHTFASDMIREGMSLPVLMRLMGHSHIEMTLRYVNLSSQDVRAEFERAILRLSQGPPHGPSFPRNP
jgi:integrase/recombinase XerD